MFPFSSFFLFKGKGREGLTVFSNRETLKDIDNVMGKSARLESQVFIPLAFFLIRNQNRNHITDHELPIDVDYLITLHLNKIAFKDVLIDTR